MNNLFASKIIPGAVISLFTAFSVTTTGQAANKIWSYYHTKPLMVKSVTQVAVPTPQISDTEPVINTIIEYVTPTPGTKPTTVPIALPVTVVPTTVPVSQASIHPTSSFTPVYTPSPVSTIKTYAEDDEDEEDEDEDEDENDFHDSEFSYQDSGRYLEAESSTDER